MTSLAEVQVSESGNTCLQPDLIVATSLVRSHVVFKLLNYVTDKIIRVAVTTLAHMLTCIIIEKGYIQVLLVITGFSTVQGHITDRSKNI